MPSDWIASRIGEGEYARLTEGLPAAELWSLLLDVFAERARQRTPADLLQQWQRDRFVQPSMVDQRTFVELDGHLLAAAHAFEAIELSPLAPLGACSVVGIASQNKIVSALRGTEVVADPTNLFALECARRLRHDPRQVVRLATCHRCVRGQQAPKGPGFAQHFRIFCLGTAGHERGNHGLLVDALIEHITTHLAALDRLEAHGYAFPGRRVRVLTTEARAELGDRIARGVTGVTVERERLEHPYYDGLRFMIGVRGPDGGEFPFIDGGAFDWVAKLTSNRKLVFVASGMGSQLAAYAFRVSASSTSRTDDAHSD
jgi:hypothetical protein